MVDCAKYRNEKVIEKDKGYKKLTRSRWFSALLFFCCIPLVCESVVAFSDHQSDWKTNCVSLRVQDENIGVCDESLARNGNDAHKLARVNDIERKEMLQCYNTFQEWTGSWLVAAEDLDSPNIDT